MIEWIGDGFIKSMRGVWDRLGTMDEGLAFLNVNQWFRENNLSDLDKDKPQRATIPRIRDYLYWGDEDDPYGCFYDWDKDVQELGIATAAEWATSHWVDRCRVVLILNLWSMCEKKRLPRETPAIDLSTLANLDEKFWTLVRFYE